MTNLHSILVPAGTIVLRDDNVQISTIADCYIENAERRSDGCFEYPIGKFRFLASAGTVQHTTPSGRLHRPERVGGQSA